MLSDSDKMSGVSECVQHPLTPNHVPAIGGRTAMADSHSIEVLAVRFWTKVNKSAPNGCWEWTAKRDNGYGRIWIKGRLFAAHRVAYELMRGQIPEGLTIDHLCRNRRCVNPEHLEVVSMRVNILRSDSVSAVNARKEHCPFGHPLAWRNSGRRFCPTCAKKWDAKKVLSPDRFAKRRARGLCIQCNTPTTMSRCDRCRKAHNARTAARRAK